MPSIPVTKVFDASLAPVFHPASASTTIVCNLIIFLPGQGDNSTNFSNFARALNLPESLTVTISPPFPLPDFLGVPGGKSWCRPEELLVDTNPAAGVAMDVGYKGLDEAVATVAQAVRKVIEESKWNAKQVHLVGNGWGGRVALKATRAVETQMKEPLGGVTSLGGSSWGAVPLATPSMTPLLVLGGSRGEVFGGASGSDTSATRRIKEEFTNVELVKWRKKEDGMPSNRDEVLPMMRFWGRTLGSRKGVPEGAVEVGRS